MHQSKVFIIIVTYNSIKWIKTCLKSCLNHNVIVVDNNSNDKTVSYIADNFPKVIVLAQNRNLGFGKGNNLGISYALKLGADYIFLLNQDAYLTNNSIEDLVALHKTNPKYGLLSPLHLNGQGSAVDAKFLNYLKRYNVLDKIFNDILNKDEKNIYEIPFVNAAAWLLPKNTLETVGGFDSLFFHYGEDRNYCQRLLYHNYLIGIVPRIKVLHDREERVFDKIESFSEAFYQHYERNHKIILGDINNDNYYQQYTTEKRKLYKQSMVCLISLNFIGLRDLLKKIKTLNHIISSIEYSRTTNKEIGRHYIN